MILSSKGDIVSVKSDEIGKEISDALGLKHVRKMDIHFEAGKIVTIDVELYPEIDGIKQFPSIFKRFELVEKKEQEGN